MTDNLTEFDQLLLDFRLLRTSTAEYMETYAINNRLIQLSSVISNQLFASVIAFVGLALAFVNIILVIQRITTELLLTSFGASAVILLVTFWLYRGQVKHRVEDQENLLKNEIARLEDGDSLFSTIRLTTEENMIPVVDRLLKDGKITQAQATRYFERFTGVTGWIDSHLAKIRKELADDKSELGRLQRNAG